MPRLDQLLARNLGVSRKKSGQLFRHRRILGPDGKSSLDPKQRVDVSSAPLNFQLDGANIVLHSRYHLMLHKPIGVVTAHKDRLHPTAYALLEGQPLFPELLAVGRLDLDASGLLLWTTEGSAIHALTHPKRRIPRTYHVALAGPWRALPSDGLRLDDGYQPHIRSLNSMERSAMHPALQIPDASRAFASICVESGKFHEVKRIFAALDTAVLGLARIRHGDFELPKELAPGECIPVDLSSFC